jgi:hypothetical protein
MTWAGKRQLIITIAFLIIVAVVSTPIIFKAVPNASCTDGKKNQGERGIDCSGPCVKICSNDAVSPKVLWVRPFIVADGVASAVAYISNPNPSYVAHNVPYVMKLYDEKNLLVAERHNVIDIPAKPSFPIFEGGLPIGTQTVKTAFFEFTSDPEWEKVNEVDLQNKINATAPRVENPSAPRVYADIRNDSPKSLRDIYVVALVYNEEGNVMAASRTLVESLSKNETTGVSFTWLKPFESTTSRIEIYPLIPLTPNSSI